MGTPLGPPLGCPQGSTDTATAVTHCARNLAPPGGGGGWLGHRHRGVWGAPIGCPGHTPGVPLRQYRHRHSSDTLCAQSGPHLGGAWSQTQGVVGRPHWVHPWAHPWGAPKAVQAQPQNSDILCAQPGTTWGALSKRFVGHHTGRTPGCSPWVHPPVAPRCCARVPAGARACPRARCVRVGAHACPSVRCVRVGAHACPRVRHAGVGARACPRARRVGVWARGCAPCGCHVGGSLPHMAWLLQVVFEMVAFANWQPSTPCGQANCQDLG